MWATLPHEYTCWSEREGAWTGRDDGYEYKDHGFGRMQALYQSLCTSIVVVDPVPSILNPLPPHPGFRFLSIVTWAHDRRRRDVLAQHPPATDVAFPQVKLTPGG